MAFESQWVEPGGSWTYLLAIALCESDPGLASTVALDCAMVRHVSDEDPLETARMLLEAVSVSVESSRTNRGPVFAGLLHMGDRRLLPALAKFRREMDYADVVDATALSPAYPLRPVVDFYLEWLEEILGRPEWDGQFGAVAGRLAGLARTLEGEVLLDLRRNFGLVESVAPVEVEAQTPVGEYAPAVVARLQAMIPQETEPKLLPDVVLEWRLARD